MRSEAKIKADLVDVGKRLADIPGLHARKIELFREARDAGMKFGDIGAAAGLTESAVIKALARADAKT